MLLLANHLYVTIILANLFASSDAKSSPSMELAWKTYLAMNVKRGENVIFSPHSLQNALGMLLLGSGERSEDALKKILETDKWWDLTEDFHESVRRANKQIKQTDKSDSTTVKMANGIFVKDGLRINSKFASPLDSYYRAATQATPFEADREASRAIINSFIATRTNNNFADMLMSPPDRSNVILLVQAIYFKAVWSVPFILEETKQMVFHGKNSDVTVDFMVRPAAPQSTTCALKSQYEIIELPYADRKNSMFFILPFTKVELTDLHRLLDAATIDHIIKTMNRPNCSVSISMPKFRMTNKVSLKKLFSEMGSRHIFDKQSADWASMFDKGSDKTELSDVIHGAKLEVDEEGSSADDESKPLELGAEERKIILNKPFLFFVQHKPTESVLFWGRMENPSILGRPGVVVRKY